MRTEGSNRLVWIRTLAVAVAIAIVVLAGASPARAASDPTAADNQYGAVLGEQAGGGGSPQIGAGMLPFTGLDLLLVLGAGTGLAAAGVGIRRAAGDPEASETRS
jgi:hypothetical protein